MFPVGGCGSPFLVGGRGRREGKERESGLKSAHSCLIQVTLFKKRVDARTLDPWDWPILSLFGPAAQSRNASTTCPGGTKLWALCATCGAEQGLMKLNHRVPVTPQLKEASCERFVRPWQRLSISEVAIYQFGMQEAFRLKPAEILCPGSLQCSVQCVHVAWKKYRWNFICRNRDTALT